MTDPLDTLAAHLAHLAPSLTEMANGAETLLEVVRIYGVPQTSEALAQLEIMERATVLMEQFARTCGDAVPRLRKALDELLRLHRVN